VLKVNAPPGDAGFDAAWEIDLFGATRSGVKAADAVVQSSVDEAHDTLLTLRAEVARNYLELRDAQTRLRVTRENMASRREVAALNATLRQAGLRSELDVSQARSLYLALEPQIPVLETAIDRSMRRIEVLLGETPGVLTATLATPQPVPVAGEAVPLSDPVSVLAQRPDVGAAER
jgi:outer membrane protein TolC